jgi:predicted transposase YbfD/YdcC
MAKRKPKAKATMGETQTMESLLALFQMLPDPRVERTKAYPLDEVLFLVLSAVVSGVNFVTEIEEFGNAKLDWFRSILPFENGIPSHDTIGRILGILDPDALELMFISWMSSASKSVEGVIAIDGKALRRAISREATPSFIHMVSAFASKNAMVLAQVKAKEKSNEITAIPKLLDLLYLKGATVTIDAAGCQNAITDKIIERGGDFVIAVKKNQPTLFDDIKRSFDAVKLPGKQGFASEHSTKEKGHGREEKRKCETLDAQGLISDEKKWPHIKTFIRVTSERSVKGETSIHTRYFMSSIASQKAQEALQVTREHWHIENKLHWNLDVSFREDECRVYAANAAENLVVVRHMALNLLRSVKNVRGGIASRRNKAAWTDDVRAKILLASPN